MRRGRNFISRESRFTVALLALAGLATGCQTYHAMPLNSSAVDAPLTTPRLESLRSRVAEIHHSLLPPTELHPELGLTPDEAAVVAILVNPTLRALRDQRGTAQAAVLQAGLLPNPQLSYNYDWVTGGNTQGAVNAYGLGLSYDIRSLLTHDATLRATRQTAESVDLTIAWQEWQVAEAAKQAVYDLISMQAQVAASSEIDKRLEENLHLLQRAEAQHLKTVVDVAAAQVATIDAHAIMLQAQRDLDRQKLALNRALGVAASSDVALRAGMQLPRRFNLPAEEDLLNDLEHRRLDLVALQHGYESQEQTLRAAVINQFPKINLGFNRASDNTDVHSAGLAVTVDLPIFDRNQGSIAAEKATRQRLFDEYATRVFEARNDISTALHELRLINDQVAFAEAALPDLKQLVDLYQQAVDRGNGDILSYYGARNNLAQKNLDVLKLKQQLTDTRIALELASGRYFPDVFPESNPSSKPVASAGTTPLPSPAEGISQ